GGRSWWSLLVIHAPERATPSAPPSERKNDAAEVATPRSAGSTAFWMAVVRLGITSPRPTPSATSDSSSGSSVFPHRASQERATNAHTATASPATGRGL